MHIISEFHDDQYPKKGNWKLREVSRAIVMDENENFAVHKIKRNDQFGDYEYYETPGGGIDEGENPLSTVERECEEELGYKIEVIEEIGVVKDEYALLGRVNINHYYLAKRGEFVGKHFVSQGDSLIVETLYLPIDEIIELYKNLPDKDIPLLLKRRELPIWLEAKKILSNKK